MAGAVDLKVLWTPKGGSQTELTDVNRVTIRRGSDNKSSKATITLQNA